MAELNFRGEGMAWGREGEGLRHHMHFGMGEGGGGGGVGGPRPPRAPGELGEGFFVLDSFNTWL